MRVIEFRLEFWRRGMLFSFGNFEFSGLLTFQAGYTQRWLWDQSHRLMARVWAEGKCIAGHVGVWFLQISECVTLLGPFAGDDEKGRVPRKLMLPSLMTRHLMDRNIVW